MGSPGGTVHARVRDDGMVSVDMGVPNFDPRTLPMQTPQEASSYTLMVNGVPHEVGAVSIGNPHAVLKVPDTRTAPVAGLGPAVQQLASFPKGVNVGFMQILDPRHISLRVFERGAGETMACGTGACAAVAVGRRWELLEGEVQVDLPGGTARVSWGGAGQHVWLTGPAVTVFTGSVDLTRFTGAKQ
jgi:diaminopimelate epimerase